MTNGYENGGLWVPDESAMGNAIIKAEMMGAVMDEFEQMSGQEGVVNVLGKVGELIPNPRAEWTGNVSVDRRLESAEITRADIETLERNIGKYYVPTAHGSRIRCIDERYDEDYDDTLYEQFAKALGPQIPGGTIGGAVAYRLSTGESLHDYTDAVMDDDIEQFGKRNVDTGFAAGDHSDENAAPGRMGCGAVDGAEDSQRKVNPNNIATIEGLTSAIQGADYDPKQFKSFVANATYLLASPKYFVGIDHRIEKLKQLNPEATPKLMGKHNGVLVMINTVPYTTLHRDHVSALSEHKIQAFNYDFWYSKLISTKLFPDNPDQQSRYVHARLGMAVATLMYLLDGSLDVGIRTPSQAA